MPVGDGLERMAGTKQQTFRQMFANELKANRSATLIEATIHRNCRHSGKVELGSVAQQLRDIALQHFQPFRRGGRRRPYNRDQHHIDVLEYVCHLAKEFAAHDLSLAKVHCADTACAGRNPPSPGPYSAARLG